MTRRSKLLLALLLALLLHGALLMPWGGGDSQMPEGSGVGLGSGDAPENESVTVLAPQEIPGAGSAAAAAQAAPSGGGGGHGSYLARLRAHLNRYKTPPPAEVGARGTALVRFTVTPDGAVLDVDVSRSSGSPDLDMQAVALVLRAVPLPAPPEGKAQTLVVPIEYR